MQKQTAKMYAILIALLAIGGLFIKDGHLFGLTNADTALDWTRVALAALLLYAGFKSKNAGFVRGSLMFVGVMYVGLAVLGLMDSELWGLLPNGLTGFDIVFHAVTGVAAIGVAMRNNSDREAVKD